MKDAKLLKSFLDSINLREATIRLELLAIEVDRFVYSVRDAEDVLGPWYKYSVFSPRAKNTG